MAKISEEELNKLIESDRKLKDRYKKQNEYLAGKYDRINFTVPAGKKAEVEAAAKAVGVSLNAFCRDAVLEAAEKVLKCPGHFAPDQLPEQEEQTQDRPEDMPPFM